MAKARARTKAAPPGPRPVDRQVRWSDVLNTHPTRYDGRPLADALALAHDLGFEFVAHQGTIYRVWSAALGSPVTRSYQLDGTPIRYGEDAARRTVLPADVTFTWYVVVRYAWERSGERFYFLHDDCPGWPVAVYTDGDAAEAECGRRNHDERATTDDLFEYFDRDVERYEEMIGVPWPAWRDWLVGCDIVPPPLHTPGEQEDAHTALADWWRDGFGAVDYGAAAWRDNRREGLWTDAQVRDAARHVRVDFYTVDLVRAGTPVPPP